LWGPKYPVSQLRRRRNSWSIAEQDVVTTIFGNDLAAGGTTFQVRRDLLMELRV